MKRCDGYKVYPARSGQERGPARCGRFAITGYDNSSSAAQNEAACTRQQILATVVEVAVVVVTRGDMTTMPSEDAERVLYVAHTVSVIRCAVSSIQSLSFKGVRNDGPSCCLDKNLRL